MTIFIFGEAMLEYHTRGGAHGVQYGGDTLNTAIHLSRMGHDVAYATAVGADPVSDALIAAWAAEGLNTNHILRHPQRSPGMYAIHLDDKGERSFLYWRDHSAARDMFSLPEMDAVITAAQKANLLYFSLITLAILPDDGRRKLLDLAATLRQNGGQVAYDSNFRPNLWANFAEARMWSQRAMAVTDIGLPTNVDECQLHEQQLSEAEIAARWTDSGCSEVVVKAGEKGCLLSRAGEAPVHFDANLVTVIDSSGAGDAFNAGYLGGRVAGMTAQDAIAKGQALASKVIGQYGAIPAMDT
ncbi:sugar kinase [Sphingorhabdus arenilitoris]|uniref:Sugar kinase n=1 Tax=Sphingorhabdus arenilitoris TaxID=1490041 RepID=A0ABV8RI85_9SPHN